MTSTTKTKQKNNRKPLVISSGYRYNIKERLAKLNYSEKNLVMNYVERKTCKTTNVHYGKQLLYRYINEPKGSNSHNNVEILAAFAKKFNCTIDELINK